MEGYQLKIFVKRSSQPIWRIVEVPAIMTFIELHLTIQEMFGLDNEFLFRFELEEVNILVTELDDYDAKHLNKKIILCNEKISNYLYEGMIFNYLYDLEDNWEFKVVVEKKIADVAVIPVVIDYCGNNLVEKCGGILGYQQVINELDIKQINFDLKVVNERLCQFGVDEVINNHLIKNDFILILSKLKNIIEERNIESSQVIKLNGSITTYWVIIKTIGGYVIELFEKYVDLLQGFYNLPTDSLNHAFCYCYTFLLSDKVMDIGQTLDQEHKISAFFNEPGYLSSLINVDDGIIVLDLLKELFIGLNYDYNTNETDEIIEISVRNNKFEGSSIYVHEPQMDTSIYNPNYRSEEKLNISLSLLDRVCLDIICLPTPDTYITNQLQIYAVIATKDDYLIKEVLFPDKLLMSETLIDIMIDFFKQMGKPNQVVINNLNVLLLINVFLKDNDINYIEEDTDLEIDLALSDAFGFNDEINEIGNDSYIQELLKELEDKNEEEIEAKLDALLAQKELLN